MPYQPPDLQHGTQDCPKCQFSMEYLRDSAVLNRDYGYSLDTSGRIWDPDNNIITSYLFGNLFRFFSPLFSKLWGNRGNRRFQKILNEYPRSLICTHCEFVIKRK
jgi:hypothetical protein